MTLPSTSEAPEAIVVAIAEVEAIEASLEDARAAEAEARAGLAEAATLDRRALADARAAGREHPGRPHRDRAEAELARATEIVEADELRLQDARAAVSEAVAKHAEEWAESVAEARSKADAAFGKALARLQEAEARRVSYAASPTGSRHALRAGR